MAMVQFKGGAKPPPSHPNSPSTYIPPATQAQFVGAAPAQQATTAQSQGTGLDLANDNQFRQQQMGFANQLQAQANGQGPSVANQQFQLAADRNVAQQQSMAASQRGTAGALAGRQAMINSAGIGQDLAAQSAIQRSQEQLNAQAQLGSVLNQGRASDIGVAGQNASLGQQNQQFNAGATNNTSQFNATQGNAQSQFNAGLNTQTNLANAGATNQGRIAQAQVNQQGNVASKYAGAQIASANINNQGAFARQVLGQLGTTDQGAFNNQNGTNNNPNPNAPPPPPKQ